MDSAYSLPTAAIPIHHHSSSEHLHHHSHTHSHSPPSLGSFPPSIPAKTDENRPIGASFGSSRRQSLGHRHSHTHDGNHSSYRANSNQPLATRPNLPTIPSSSVVPSADGHWRTSSTAGGKPLITPTHGSFDAAAMYQPPEAQSHTHHDHDHGHEHEHGPHGHDQTAERSKFTALLLPYTSRYPLLHAIMTDKDSRRIFYFMSLNFSFMAVQAFYGYVTDSLGLLSDSIHMFFDCVALGVGLYAAVAAKWPPSERFPYGFGKIETLSGFANGVFLMLISVEIMFEAFERILEGRETKRLTELFVVSTLGLLVNLVGMAAFGHHHHGGHDHGHHHHHDHDHHGHDHDHHGHDHEGEEKKKHQPAAHGGHSHDSSNENMHGIYLHVLADTLGSGAVIVSTVLTRLSPWSGWDPLASFLIAVLILLSAMPLVKSSARRLLLAVPDEVEYGLRDTLSGILGLRGVVSYAAPRFWLDDRSEAGGGGGGGGNKLLGVMHVVAARGADMDDVRDRVRAYMLDKGIDITVQVEREGDSGCWCGLGRSPLGMHQSKPSGVF